MIFKDRHDAGQQLAKNLIKYKNDPSAIVLAIPRGGVVIGYEIAKKLNLPLDIIVTKKIGAPDNPEYAIGSVNMDGDVLVDEAAVKMYNISDDYLKQQSEILKSAIKKKLISLKGTDKLPDLADKTVLLVDDGIATGYTMKAAITFLKRKTIKKLVVAVPVAPPDTITKLEGEIDEVICLYSPIFFGAVGAFYEDFSQTEDEECKKYLAKI